MSTLLIWSQNIQDTHSSYAGAYIYLLFSVTNLCFWKHAEAMIVVKRSYKYNTYKYL